jgi:hypothetical protein
VEKVNLVVEHEERRYLTMHLKYLTGSKNTIPNTPP